MELIDDRLIDWQKYLQAPADAAHVRPASEWCDGVIARLQGDKRITGAKLPWFRTHDKIRFRSGEVSIWSGVNGHGKSLIQSHASLGFMAQGEKVCIASMEMLPVATMYRMTRQSSGGVFPTEESVRDFHGWTDGRLWLYDQQGSVSTDRILALGRYVSQEIGIKHFVVDSLMKCGIGTDDYNRQKDFVDALTAMAKDTGLHIHLVAHSKKGQTEYSQPGKFDVKGASEITDQADNVLTVWRNKAKEENHNEHGNEPDALLTVSKQRHGEWEGKIALWFNKASMTYLESENDYPKHYEALAEGVCR